ncbi:Aerobic respiration control sensor protein ArcB [Pseudoalteromonas sp. THAF3]|uniref:PAS domain-containing hybrid sensor histidine kinase/response regulator n=1 Tax=Pseudoalteromonas sp. THAF3 TaxID=2587843 RepID=UPI001268EA62|nr:PAS domain-containing hybrid sensor histidine kinase/response regulator [Pseudoalteromonas sp. THAF3]QFU06198.1 Aerobic respiration control sensor protein ArcB [Pseudoalteromonas sp. THAF3]
MFSIGVISLIALAYLGVLFAVAWYADKHTKNHSSGWIYGLSLGVYCTSWAFYGTTAQAANNGWWLAPTYAGTILLFTFGWAIYRRIAHVCRQQQLTSLADFLATRYGQSSQLSGLVSLISVIAIVPYIALQLNATSASIAMLTDRPVQGGYFWQDSTFFITALLALFAILFGARRVRPSEHNPGLMASIAFESVVKLLAFLGVGLFICFEIFDSPHALYSAAQQQDISAQVAATASPTYVYWVHVGLGFLATLCLPRQFHTAFIEHDNEHQLVTARWLFPIYLLLINLFILPIAYAGLVYFQDQSVGYDTFVLALPIAVQSPSFSLLAFLGGFSAATSMVIVSTIVLSIMITNDFINQFLLRRSQLSSSHRGLSKFKLLQARRAVIVAVLLLSYASHRVLAEGNTLANMGLMSFTLVAQFAPAMIIGLWWSKASCRGAQWGIIAGFAIWFYTLLLPNLYAALFGEALWLSTGPWGMEWLAPRDLFALGLDELSQAVLLSLGVNTLVYISVPLLSSAQLAERLQSNKFIITASPQRSGHIALSYQDLALLLQRFSEPERAKALVSHYFPASSSRWKEQAPEHIEQRVEREMSALVGGASARLILDVAKDEKRQPFEQVADFVDEASQVLRFNRDLLQATIENIEQGISVVDSDLKLVAWNQGYQSMFSYPDDSLVVGRPVAELIRFNAERGLFAYQDIDTEVEKRIAHLRRGSAYKYRRQHNDGRVFEMQGNPLPGGGFVTTYTDITDFINQQRELEQANLNLEEKIAARTQQLVATNHALAEAKREAEQATESKTRFFAAASHDLLQPFNAASLFCSLMSEKASNTELSELANNIRSSLASAEDLLSSILQLTKLESGSFKVNSSDFSLSSLLQPLANEYGALARDKGLAFQVQGAEVMLKTDKALLKRVLGNLLSNAIRYTEQGEIRLLCESHQGQLSIMVEDTGSGIAQQDQELIFEEFKQLQGKEQAQGLGLGLAISKRICSVLAINLTLGSQLGKGTQFTLTLPCFASTSEETSSPLETRHVDNQLEGLRIWLLDNDDNVLSALSQVLENWGCKVQVARNQAQLRDVQAHSEADILIADYQLDDGVTGLEVISALNLTTMAIVINTANHDENIREQVSDCGYPLLYKPLKTPALKRMLKRLKPK